MKAKKSTGTRERSKKRHAKLTKNISTTTQMNKSNMGPRSKVHMLSARLSDYRKKYPMHKRTNQVQWRIDNLKSELAKLKKKK